MTHHRGPAAMAKELLIGPRGPVYAERWLHCPQCHPRQGLLATEHRYTLIEERWFCTQCGYRQEPTA